jgi:hypothetical protein
MPHATPRKAERDTNYMSNWSSTAEHAHRCLALRGSIAAWERLLKTLMPSGRQAHLDDPEQRAGSLRLEPAPQ